MKAKIKCEYCNSELKSGNICGTCKVKLKLIRKIKQMIKDTIERKDER